MRVQKSMKNVDSRTRQEFRDGTRVDSVLRKYATIGVDINEVGLFSANVARMPFGIQPDPNGYQEMLNKVIRVKDYFAALPSAIRDRFAHDPAQMLAFMANPENLEECQEMGLISKPKAAQGSGRKDKDEEAPEAGKGAVASAPAPK